MTQRLSPTFNKSADRDIANCHIHVMCENFTSSNLFILVFCSATTGILIHTIHLESLIYVFYLQIMASKTATVSMENAVSFFVDALSDFNHPKYCATCLIGSLSVIRAERQGKITIVLTKYHTFWNTTIAFLTAERSKDDLESLHSALSTCHPKSDPTRRKYHNMGQPTIDRYASDEKNTPYSVFFMMLFTCCGHAFSLASEVSLAKGVQKSWPTSPYDLIPYGPQVTVESMHHWMTILPIPFAVTFLAELVRLCRSLVIPAIVYSPTFLEDFTTRLHEICTRAKSWNGVPSQRLYGLDKAYRPLGHYMLFLRSWREVEPSLTYRTHLLRGKQLELLQLSSDAIYITQSPFIPHADRQGMLLVADAFAQFAQSLLITFSIDESIGVHLHPSIAGDPNATPEKRLKFREENPLFNVFWRLIETRKTHLCSARECRNTFQSTGRKFGRCGRCHIVSYCGPECQKRAWTDGDLAHKTVCKTLRKLQFSPKSDYTFGSFNEFAEKCRQANITADDEDIVVLKAWLVRWWRTVDELDHPGPYIPGPNGL